MIGMSLLLIGGLALSARPGHHGPGATLTTHDVNLTGHRQDLCLCLCCGVGVKIADADLVAPPLAEHEAADDATLMTGSLQDGGFRFRCGFLGVLTHDQVNASRIGSPCPEP